MTSNKKDLLVDELIEVNLNGRNRQHYINLGYEIAEFQKTLQVKITDIPKCSEILIKVKCQKCGKETKMTVHNFNRFKRILCEDCSAYRNKPLKCQFCGEETNRKHSNGLGICNKHRYQLQRYGHIIQGRYEENKFIFENDHIKILLESNGEILKEYGIIDIDDFEKIKKYRWHLEKSKGDLKYIACCSEGKTKRIHNIIMGTYEDLVIDHINGNGLDNRKQNLRVATISENALNCKAHDSNKLGIKNIVQISKNQFIFQIKINGNTTRKLFDNLEDAIDFRNDFYKTNSIISQHFSDEFETNV